jgi:tRNA U38,U39,U40 pseudouridine synthase TruA
VGAAVRAGTGKVSVDQLRGTLEGSPGASCEFIAPPHGLYLMRVDYSEIEFGDWE